MAKKKARTPQEWSADPAAVEILCWAEEEGYGTAFSRADALAPCPIGSQGLCCKNCSMGPCRLTKEGATGVCGATQATVAARNFARMVAGGAAATLSHTASLAGSFQAFKACCDQAGFYLLEELTEDPKVLINLISILTTQPRARGRRVAVVSVGGGAAILLADQVTEQNMALAEFAPETKARFQALLGGKVQASTPEEKERITARLGSNPVDLFGDCDDERLLSALRILDEDPNTDVILTALYYQVPYLSEYLLERLVDLRREISKPLILSPRGFSKHVLRSREYLYSMNFHTYTVPMITPLSIAVEIWERYGRGFMNGKGEG